MKQLFYKLPVLFGELPGTCGNKRIDVTVQSRLSFVVHGLAISQSARGTLCWLIVSQTVCRQIRVTLIKRGYLIKSIYE